MEVIDQVGPTASQPLIPPTVHESLSAYIDEVSDDLFGTKAILDAEVVQHYEKTNENNGEEDKILLYQIKDVSNFDPRSFEDYIPPSPASSNHSLYKPPTSSYQNDSEDSDFIPGK